MICQTVLIICWTLGFAASQTCPIGWLDFEESCYHFFRSPIRNREDARQFCQGYNAADLVSVNTIEEHNFISKWLRNNDPQHRRWFTSGRDSGDNLWVWDGDGTQFSNIDVLLLPDNDFNYWKYVAYNYSDIMNRWGLLKVNPLDQMSFVCEAPKEHVHEMVILEREIDYGVEVTDREKIPMGPVFSKEPEAAVFDTADRRRNNDISLKCVARGYPMPTYVWYKEENKNYMTIGRAINPLSDIRYTQTDGTITINDPQPTLDRGIYYCMASNVYGTVVSESAQLSFGSIPEFSKKRSPDRAKENWGKAISCDPPQTTSEVNYYWTRDSFPNFVQEDQRVFVSNDGNMYFSSIEKVDQASYACNIQSRISSTGRTGPFFPLEVDPGSSGQKLLFPNNFPKAFPDAPLAGDDVRLECVAYGYPIPTYNWTRRGSFGELPQGFQLFSYNRVLQLRKVRVEDIGDYICTASNGLEDIKKSILLSIQAKPEFTIPIGNKIVDKDSNVDWTCEAFGIPDVTYAWLRNGQILNPNNITGANARYRINENSFRIEAVQESDAGMFQCRAHNQLGTTFSSGQLKVLSLKPTFAKHPLDSEVYAAIGGNVTIPCRPEAAPIPEFIWRRNGNAVSTGGKNRLFPNGYLFISNVGREDQGEYACIARNQYGSDESQGRLVVLPPPRLVEYPNPRELAIVNTSTVLRCEAHIEDILDLAYIWQHNQLRIDPERHQQFSLGVNDKQGYLAIHNTTFAEAGIYRCIAKTSIAKVYADTELIVIGPPGAPGAVLADDVNATSGRVHWMDGYNNGRRVLAYNIQGRTNHNSTWLSLANNVTFWKSFPLNGRKEVELLGVLSPWSSYEFRVAALNELGLGQPSDPSPQYNTEMDIPHMYPNNVGGGGGKTSSLTISWDPLSPQDWNAPQIWYNIFYKPADSNQEMTKRDLKNLGNIGLYAVNVGEENYYREYKIRVQAINPMGEGPISPEVVIYSAEAMPQVPPSSVKAVPFNSTALNVSWMPLDLAREKIRGKLIGHRIKYYKNGEDRNLDSLILLSRGERPWSLIVGLQPNQEYYVTVMAYNDAGSGPDSEPFLARTFKAAPLRPPTSVRVKAINPTSVLVTWRGVLPSSAEEPISGYKVRYWEADKDYTSAKEVRKLLLGATELEAVVSGLAPGKVYKLRVMAFSLGGDGKMSSPPWEFRVGEGVQSSLTSGAARRITESHFFILLAAFVVFS